MSTHLRTTRAPGRGRRRLASVLAAAALALTGTSLAAAATPAVADDATPAATASATAEPTQTATAADAAADFAVTIPGSHNTEMDCASDWDVSCTRAALTYDQASGLFTGTFDLPAGTYEYKVAIGGTWDESYGANGVAGGDNISYTTTGGKVTFLYDPVSHVSWTNASEPIITLAGSFQAALGCGSDWAPDCLAAAMRPQGDGTWTFTTNKIPTGSYQVKVSESLSWDVNYGVDGKAGGDNYSFSATAGKDVTFTYTRDTHVLTIAVSDPPAAGVAEQDAYWIDATTLAWPTSLLPSGVSRTDLVADDGTPAADAPVSYALVTSHDATAALTDGAVHQSVAIEVPAYEYAEAAGLLERARLRGRTPLLVALDQVTDPHNLGAVLRSAGAFGADGVIIPERRSVGVNATVWKVSAGAAARVPVARETNLVRTLEALKKEGCFVVGLDGGGDTDVESLTVADEPLVLVTGAEGAGLSRLVRETCDVIASIPISRDVESLNAAVATGISLYEVDRLRRAAAAPQG